MDARVILDFIRRWIWLWGLVLVSTTAGGFAPLGDVSYLLAMPLIYLVIPMSSEFRKQGPMWIHRTLPIGDSALVKTAWFLTVVVPMLAVMVSLLPALAFGLIARHDNLATTSLLPFIAGGFLWTSGVFVMTALGGHLGRSKPLHFLIMVGTFLFAGGFILVLMKSAQYWELIPLRLGMVSGAILMVPISYLMAPQILQTMVRNVSEQRTVRSGETQAMYAHSVWDRVMSIPFGRTLVTGVWLLAFLFWMNLFYALLSGQSKWWSIQVGDAMFPMGMQMMAMFLFMYSFMHITSLRGMASLPLSRVRRTLTIISLPVAAATPIVVCIAFQALFTNTPLPHTLKLVVMMMYCLATAYASLAVCLRFGFIAAIGGLMLFTFVLMFRIMAEGKFGFPELVGLDVLVGLALIALAALWIHQVLDRHPSVYRRHWIPSGIRRG